MKTRISQIAAITLFALFILIGNVNAKGTEKSASSHENIEAALEIENWMINDNFWTSEDVMTIETAQEESLALECWMTSESTWELNENNDLETETETDLAFEPWMTNDKIWN